MRPILETETSYAGAGTAEAPTSVASPNGAATAFASDPALAIPPAAPSPRAKREANDGKDSLFEQFAWLYVFFREKLFRDDTERFIRALWPDRRPRPGTRLIELGCGPGFYSCALASRFPAAVVVGVDRSREQLNCARRKAERLELDNCAFAADNVLNLSYAERSFDAAIAARLFTVLPQRDRAIAEMHRVLRPGGRCLIAEPRYQIWASLPLLAMWCIAGVMRMKNGYREPHKATVLSAEAFRALFATQPWKRIDTWQDGRYQYALCEKR